LAGCARDEPRQPTSLVVLATFSQQQAIPGFDDAVYVVDDAAELDRLAELLRAHGIDGDVVIRLDCDGSRTTTIVWTDPDAEAHDLVVDSCSDDPLRSDVEALVALWRERGG